jgi:hypothetical protein
MDNAGELHGCIGCARKQVLPVWSVDLSCRYRRKVLHTGTDACCTLGHAGDEPEAQLIATRNMAANLTWRATATRVILLTSDAHFHTDTDVGIFNAAQYGSIVSTARVLIANNVKFIGLAAAAAPVAQMQQLATYTGGSVVYTTADSSNIAAAILNGLSNVSYWVIPQVQAGCPANISFTPPYLPAATTSSVATFQ